MAKPKAEKKSSRRTDAKVQVESVASLFEPYMQKPVRFSFGKFNFPITIQEIKLAKLTDMLNKPDMRVDDDGKKYSPPVMQMNTSDGILYFVLEDITVVAISRGIRIITNTNNIDFREA